MKEKINQNDIVTHVTLKVGNTVTHNQEVIDEFFEQLKRHLNADRVVVIPDFGKLFSNKIVMRGEEQIFFYITKTRQFRKRN